MSCMETSKPTPPPMLVYSTCLLACGGCTLNSGGGRLRPDTDADRPPEPHASPTCASLAVQNAQRPNFIGLNTGGGTASVLLFVPINISVCLSRLKKKDKRLNSTTLHCRFQKCSILVRISGIFLFLWIGYIYIFSKRSY